MAVPLYSAICQKCDTHTGYSHGPIEGEFVCSRCLSGQPVRKAEVVKPPPPAKAAPKLVTDFMPRGRSGFFLYAVVLAKHPMKVKIGMTRKWSTRRVSYANWDLAHGDGILSERVFRISEEYVDLRAIEAAVLSTFKARIASGSEWFEAEIDDAAAHIDNVLSGHGLSYCNS